MKRIRRMGTRNRKRRGVLTFEWILLISLLVIGIIGGLSAVRNALLCELTDMANCIEAINICGSCDDSPCSPGGSCGCGNSWWCSCGCDSCGGP